MVVDSLLVVVGNVIMTLLDVGSVVVGNVILSVNAVCRMVWCTVMETLGVVVGVAG